MTKELEFHVIPVGSPIRRCRGADCGKDVYFVSNARGVSVPIDADGNERCRAPEGQKDGLGISHFLTCLNANDFSHNRKKKR